MTITLKTVKVGDSLDNPVKGSPPLLSNYHAKFYAHELSIRSASDSVERLSQSLFDAKIDLNPHQIEAALLLLDLDGIEQDPYYHPEGDAFFTHCKFSS